MPDAITRQRAGNLAAYGFIDTQIADTLLLNMDQVAAVMQTPEFHEAKSKALAERTQRQIDLEEGWDAVEEKALASILETLQYNRDPRFALGAAAIANKAVRRTPGGNGKVINAAKAGNVIVLQMNNKFVQKVQQQSEDGEVVDVSPRPVTQIPKKRSDVPTPNAVSTLLGIVTANKMAEEVTVDATAEALRLAGIDFTGDLE